ARLSTTLKQSKATIIKAYDIVKSERNRIFRQWDACEREALIFMRDAPLGKVGRYEIRSAKSTAIELDVAFAAYLEKRRTYRKVTDIEKSLEALEKENRHLITVANKGLAQAAANTAKEVVALSKTVEGMN
ncbi:MAG TPA: hypothetical protein VL202_20115, partial [Pararhizobium sp.]|uniref:hypothetical protein n=1 Tax=Pararhizobium sp. TaxID=1977563 RepID=UPI002BB5D4BA